MLWQQEVLNLGVMQKGLADGPLQSSRMEHADVVLSVWEGLNNAPGPIPLLLLPLNNDISP